MNSNRDIAIKYAEDVVSGKKIAGEYIIKSCQRFLKDLKDDRFELYDKDADFVIGIAEKLMVHKQGEALDGTSLVNTRLVLQPWQRFVFYNLVAWRYKGTTERRFKEGFINVPRKNGKTMMVAALAWGLALLERKSGSKMYIVSGSLKQARESFEDIVYMLQYNGLIQNFKVRNNNAEHSLRYDFTDADGRPDGSIYIEALASNPDAHDSFNCNMAIADEIHAFKKPSQYNRFKEAMKAYQNKLMIGITTAGDNANSFCYRRIDYCKKVLDGTVQDETLFCFIAAADQDENGDVDYTNPIQHEKANPSYGVTIRPDEMMNDALQAQNDPQQRKDFLSRSLDIYTTAMKAYFNIEEFQASDSCYTWTIDELATRKIDWYGGADLSKLHDLTAAALFGHDREKDCDIIITHAFFPIVNAAKKAEEDGIPLFGWAEDGWLTMTNTPTVNTDEVVKWFCMMRDRGFNIKQIGHDRKFAREYFLGMKKQKFNVVDQPQYYYLKSEGFRHIEKSAKDKKLYYLGSEAYEYCVQNVRAVECSDDMIRFQKVQQESRIDLFDASVFACVRYLNNLERERKASSWWED